MKLQRLLLLVFDVMATIWQAIKDGKQKPVEKEARSTTKTNRKQSIDSSAMQRCTHTHTHIHIDANLHRSVRNKRTTITIRNNRCSNIIKHDSNSKYVQYMPTIKPTKLIIVKLRKKHAPQLHTISVNKQQIITKKKQVGCTSISVWAEGGAPKWSGCREGVKTVRRCTPHLAVRHRK